MTDLITIPELCQLAKTGRTNVYKLINSGRLQAVKLGKKTLVKKADYESFVASLSPYSVKKQDVGGKDETTSN